MPAPTTSAPNHHAHHPGFTGIPGLIAGLSFAIGRDAVARLAAERTQIGADDWLVDIGCGPGAAVREALRRGATAIGVDPAPVMLRLARLMTRDPRASWMPGAAESLPLTDDSVTVAWSLSTVHHWNDIDQGLAEVQRVLEPGGRFLVTERRIRRGSTGHASHGWTIDQADAFAARCTSARLAEVDVSTHTPGNRPTLVVQATKSLGAAPVQ
jgi:ubiquinone/menaquinone biosynthesis C-methylase UbiE